jgi:hypothetical protein
VTLEGPPEGTETRVVLRTLGATTQPITLGVVQHIEGSARRGTVAPRALAGAQPRVYVVAAERPSRHGSSYQSALWRVDGVGHTPVRLVGDLVDASRAVVTERGSVLVQRGRDGEDPSVSDHVLRERVDALIIDRVDPENGATTRLWQGRGMLAYLATRLSGDEVLVYHVHEGGASLFALDARTRTTRVLLHRFDALARDFSYDHARDEVTFVRASAVGSDTYEVVTFHAHGDPALRVRWRGVSDHLMPYAVGRGEVALSLPGDRGLASLGDGAREPVRWAPLGDGADEVFAVTENGAWIAFRHRTATREMFALYAPASRHTVLLDRPEVYVECAGFVDEVRP